MARAAGRWGGGRASPAGYQTTIQRRAGLGVTTDDGSPATERGQVIPRSTSARLPAAPGTAGRTPRSHLLRPWLGLQLRCHPTGEWPGEMPAGLGAPWSGSVRHRGGRVCWELRGARRLTLLLLLAAKPRFLIRMGTFSPFGPRPRHCLLPRLGAGTGRGPGAPGPSMAMCPPGCQGPGCGGGAGFLRTGQSQPWLPLRPGKRLREKNTSILPGDWEAASP